MRIKTCRDQDHVGPEEINSGEDFFGEGLHVGLIVGARIHRAVQRGALAGPGAGL